MKLRNLTTVILLMVFGLITTAQQMVPLPIDPKVKYGKLENGLTYYIRHNSFPKNRAEFYIAQNVGSILENDSQRGLAHFLEHMAFNGSKNFPGKSMLNYLEANGVKFGTDVNAYTAFDETVYNISNVPVNREGIIDSCLLILHDWSNAIALEDKEIDEERGVIREEWRTRTNANMRILEKLIPQIFAGSQYANRMPIGTMDIVMNFPYQTLKDYYHKWYRPDLQAIIIVGDINVDITEKKLKEIFNTIPKPENAAERIYYTVPDNKEPIIAIAKDKEATGSQVTVYYKHKPLTKELKATIAGVTDSYLKSVTAMMLNDRLKEISEKPNAPFMSAYSYDGNFIVSKTMDAFTTMAISKEGETANALKALLQETERVNRFGFTDSEYQRAKANLMSMLESMYKEREKQKNSSYVEEYVSHFTDGGSISGIETDYALFKKIASSTGIDQINKYIQNLIGEENIVVTITGPEKEGVSYPSETEILSLLKNTKKEELQPYADKVSNEPLISKEPTAGNIVKTMIDKKFGTTTWILSNGAKVVIKPTTFKDDEILMSGISKGGSLLYGEKDIPNLKVFNNIIDLGGLGNFNNIDLKKVLAGKNVALTIGLDDRSEIVNGSSTPKDLPTLMQLLYLSFTDQHKDIEAVEAWKSKVKDMLKNVSANPRSAFKDSLNVALYKTNQRKMSLKPEEIDRTDYDRILQIWKERFGDASDFTFTFVGNINEQELKPLVEKYIASLPSTYSKEKPGIDKIGIRMNNYTNHFEKPMQTLTSTVYAAYVGKCKYSLENNIKLSMFDQIMDIVYTATIREEEGGTYGVGTQSVLSKETNTWMFLLGFDTNPEMQEKLQKRAIAELQKTVTDGPSEKDFNKVKEYMLKNHTENLHENKYWLGKINTYNRYGIDDLSEFEDIVQKQTPESIQKFMKKLFSKAALIEVSMKGIQE
ncbi:M16 family metallopeptidase [Coprobacter sp.]